MPYTDPVEIKNYLWQELRLHDIDYTLHPDGTVDIHKGLPNGQEELYLSHASFWQGRSPIRWGTIRCGLYVDCRNIVTMEGFPQEIHGRFALRDGGGKLTSWAGAPRMVHGGIDIRAHALTDLSGLPQQTPGVHGGSITTDINWSGMLCLNMAGVTDYSPLEHRDLGWPGQLLIAPYREDGNYLRIITFKGIKRVRFHTGFDPEWTADEVEEKLSDILARGAEMYRTKGRGRAMLWTQEELVKAGYEAHARW